MFTLIFTCLFVRKQLEEKRNIKVPVSYLTIAVRITCFHHNAQVLFESKKEEKKRSTNKEAGRGSLVEEGGDTWALDKNLQLFSYLYVVALSTVLEALED